MPRERTKWVIGVWRSRRSMPAMLIRGRFAVLENPARSCGYLLGRIMLYLHITSISWTCVACPQGAGRDAWHTYSPVSFRFTCETSKLLFEYILTLSGGTCRGSPLSARRMPSLHHLTLVCTFSGQETPMRNFSISSRLRSREKM